MRIFYSVANVIALMLFVVACSTPTSTPSPTSTPTPISTPVPTPTPALTPRPAPTATNIEKTPGEIKEMKQYSSPPAMTIDSKKAYTATMYTSKGDIVLELFSQDAPKTVNNFVFLAREGFYNGTKFHRVIKDFMIQGGDPQGTGGGGPGYRFADEPVKRDYLSGIIAMANAGPNTNGSQFFIMHKSVNLPKNYTIFGKVTQGMDVVDKIANSPVIRNAMGENASPVEDLVVKSIDINETAPVQ